MTDQTEALARAWSMAKVDPDPSPLPVRLAYALAALGYEVRPIAVPTKVKSGRSYEVPPSTGLLELEQAAEAADREAAEPMGRTNDHEY